MHLASFLYTFDCKQLFQILFNDLVFFFRSCIVQDERIQTRCEWKGRRWRANKVFFSCLGTTCHFFAGLLIIILCLEVNWFWNFILIRKWRTQTPHFVVMLKNINKIRKSSVVYQLDLVKFSNNSSTIR